MLIQIVSVEQGQVPAGKKYKMIEVAFKGEDGKVAGKKIMDFSYPTVYNTLKAASQGDKFDVTTVKEGDYWNWSAIKKAEGNTGGGGLGAVGVAGTAQSPTQSYAASSNDRYETKEERLARQKYIIRQSSLSTAVETLAVGSKGVDPDKVVELARKYEAYVFETNPIQELMDMSDDLPE